MQSGHDFAVHADDDHHQRAGDARNDHRGARKRAAADHLDGFQQPAAAGLRDFALLHARLDDFLLLDEVFLI